MTMRASKLMRALPLIACCVPSVAYGDPQREKDVVMLEAVGASGPCTENGFMGLEFIQNLPDGNPAPFPTTPIPPRGKLLLVTDVDWALNGGDPNSTHVLRLFVVNKAGPQSFRAMESKIQLDPLGAGATTTSATTGFTMSNAAALCVDVIAVGGTNSGLLQGVLLRGRFLDDK